ncbi:lactonase family protein [Leptospira gomenensis]|uniref:lactonase family protein n=1 Tax=Leptospira gomenensis TaxID=2484974 RepID=UPI0014385A98|nr:beta-propeller fold lactonase family protein [Leptospira gomenensis]
MDLRNSCDPFGESFKTTFALKMALGDSSGICGISRGVSVDLKIISQVPEDGLVSVSRASVLEFTFGESMNPTTLVAQEVSGICSGSIQVSSDDFLSCVGGSLDTSANPKVVFTPARILSGGVRYKLRVTQNALNLRNESMASVYTSPVGFTTGGSWVYVSNYTNGQIWGFTLDPSNGTLASNGLPVTSNLGTVSLAAHPSGKFLYAANETAGTITFYSIDAGTGRLTSIGSIPSAGARTLFVEPSGKFAFATGSTGNVIFQYKIDQTSGALSFNVVSTYVLSGTPIAMTLDPTGTFAFVSAFTTGTITFFGIDSAGFLNARSNTPSTSGTAFLKTDPSGRFLYSVNSSASVVDIFQIDYTLGLLTYIGNFTTGTTPSNMDFDPAGVYAYISNNASVTNHVSIARLDPITGSLTATGASLMASMSTRNVIVDPSGKYAFTTESSGSTVYMFVVDPTTGAMLPNIPSFIGAGTGNPGPYAILIF